MKISKTINAPVEFVYNQILDSSLYDIEKILDTDLTSSLLMALNTQKHLAKTNMELLRLMKL